MDDLSRKTALIADWGLFTHIAEGLAAEGKFARVLYYTEWEAAFPSLAPRLVGQGLPGVERVHDFWEAVDKADLIVFPDVYMAGKAEYLRRQGKRVWGAGAAEYLETDRVKAKATLESVGLATGDWEIVRGCDALEKRLARVKECYIKCSYYRAEFETFHHQRPWLTKYWIDQRRAHLGPRQDGFEFILEMPIKGVEIGYDGSTVDGKFSDPSMWGIEEKGAGYLGQVVAYEDLPQPILRVNKALAPVLDQLNARCFYSDEIRGAVLIDPCTRAANPPSQSYLSVFDNWSEHIWHGAGGELVDLSPVARYAAQLQLWSEEAKDKWLPVEVPQALRPFVKLQRLCVIDGHEFVAPGAQGVGAVVGFDDELEEAIRLCLERAEEVKSLGIEFRKDALDAVLEQIEEAGKAGISW